MYAKCLHTARRSRQKPTKQKTTDIAGCSKHVCWSATNTGLSVGQFVHHAPLQVIPTSSEVLWIVQQNLLFKKNGMCSCHTQLNLRPINCSFLMLQSASHLKTMTFLWPEWHKCPGNSSEGCAPGNAADSDFIQLHDLGKLCCRTDIPLLEQLT